jgi:hypothetical protein
MDEIYAWHEPHFPSHVRCGITGHAGEVRYHPDVQIMISRQVFDFVNSIPYLTPAVIFVPLQ